MLQEYIFNNCTIRMEKRADGSIWVCITDMAKASDKRVGHWFELKSTREFLTAFAESVGKTIDQIIELNESKGTNDQRGTWAIQEIAIKFAAWCSVDFEIWMLDKSELPNTNLRV